MPKINDMFTDKDLKQIADKGLTPKEIEKQIDNFKQGFPHVVLDAAATPGNGLTSYGESEVNELSKYFDLNYEDYNIIKFVPASGAASRMFKALFEFKQWYKGTPSDIEKYLSDKGANSVFYFFNNISKFAFYNHLKLLMESDGLNITKLISDNNFIPVLDYFITDKGMNYASLPKGLLLFHSYVEGGPRLAVEEHLVESAVYSKDSNRIAHLQLTVSPEHQSKFEEAVSNKMNKYEAKYHVTFDVSFSQQKSYTDIVAVDTDNEPFRLDDGSLLFRPGGHGALIENLNDIDSEIIFIKNIDNIVPDRLRDTTYQYKKVIGGLLFKLQDKTFNYLDMLDSGELSDEELETVLKFAKNELNIFIPDAYEGYDKMDRIDFLFNKLNRPIRVCGMVKNEGEPGGGPFWVNNNGDKSLQIVESSQMNLKDEKQKQIVENATHFNPVDLVCGVYNFKGEKFNLKDFVDANTGFISEKSLNGKTLKAQELPGLWNGAMADWITIFVETPIITFNPVKVIVDLLRPQHQPAN